MKNLPKFNKGEWAELLVLIKIILQQNIVLYNEKLQTTNKIFEVLSIHSKQNVIIQLYDNILTIRVNDVITVMEKIINLVTPSDYELLFNEIFNNKDTTFTPANIPVNIQNKLLKFIDLKTRSTIKSDILLDVKNIDILEQKLTSGFSIKSYIGGLSTLLNASSGTNFIYKIVGDTKNLSELVINSIDTKSKIRERINRIDSLGLKLEFYKTEKNEMFHNLNMIDSKMAFFIAEILLKFYQGYNNSIKEYIVTESNIFSDNDIKAYKLKSFLRAFALGAFPSKLWNGVETSHGLIILKKSGEVGALHILYSRDLENYLLNNSCFDTPSSTRHQFGEIYQDQNEYFIKLNLQIRIQQKHTI